MSKTRAHGRKYAALLLIVLLLAMLASYALAQEETPGTAVRSTAHLSVAKSDYSTLTKGLHENWQGMREGALAHTQLPDRGQLYSSPLPSGIRLPITTAAFETQSLTGTTACGNIIANSRLNILEFGDGTGTAEPWVFLIPQLFYINENDPDDPFGPWAYDGYSLVFRDGDPGDPSPKIDMFGQGFLMPDNLSDVTVEYWRATVDGNAADEVWGELWLLDDTGTLHLDNPDKYLVGFWDVFESKDEWNLESVVAPKDMVKDLDGQLAALIFYNYTDGSAPDAPESKKEWMLIDDITLTVCYKPATVTGKRSYLPTIQKTGEVAPYCVPPSENPRDEYHSNRGYTQTAAACKSALSELDKADYYTFKPNKSGSHTLHLKKLPDKTEWSAMIFEDKATPEYAPGNSDSGRCHIDTPGSKDKKVTCDLKKDKEYFIKVSAGSTPKTGGYEMKVVTP